MPPACLGLLGANETPFSFGLSMSGRAFDLEAKGLLSGLEIGVFVPEKACRRLCGTTELLQVEATGFAWCPVSRRWRFLGDRPEMAHDGMGLLGNLVTAMIRQESNRRF
jgi:hypothetical protein